MLGPRATWSAQRGWPRATENRRDEHGEQRDQDDVSREDEPRHRLVEVQRVVPVLLREPRLREQERGDEEDSAVGRRASTTSGISQIRNCGESTFPRATNATTAAAEN